MLETDSLIDVPLGIKLKGEMRPYFGEILTAGALDFLVALHEHFNTTRKALLEKRAARQQEYDAGFLPNFLPETREIRESNWKVAPIPDEILDRRVEITGPVDRKMIINALNSGARVFMADFEDSNAPTWTNTIEGQINLKDAITGEISYENPNNGKEYRLNKDTAVLFVRPRGFHLEEKHLEIHEQPASASLVDFGLYFFHNAEELLKKGSRPYFYLPKLESHLEAKLWNDIFIFAQSYLGIQPGTIKATVLIETLPAAFEMHEILYALREHSAGLNCGRWDYIFSYIKKFRNHHKMCLPNRDQVTMSVPCMQAYADLVIQTCHRRGAHAMGGMAAQIPIKSDEQANDAAMEKVRHDKLREVMSGHDGTWVAHPALVPVAMEIFNKYMPQPNQLHNRRHDVAVTAQDLIRTPTGTITLEGIRININVGICYLESWLSGNGAAALYHLMEDAATAEISRSQLWQWIHHGCSTGSGVPITVELYEQLKADELASIRSRIGDDAYENGRFQEAVALFDRLVKSPELEEFLTIPAYELIN